jgi:hypothetical protein
VRRVAVGVDVFEPVRADPGARGLLPVDAGLPVSVDEQLVLRR